MAWEHKLSELAQVIGAAPVSEDRPFSGISTDTRTLERGQVFFALKGEHYDASDFLDQALGAGACAAVATKAGKGPTLVVDDTLRALQQFAKHHRSQLPVRVIAITGSCGKTTTKDLVHAVLSTKFTVAKTEGNLNNEIGCPTTLLRLDASHDMAVVEMGANHMGEIAHLCSLAAPSESTITMIGPAHLEGFGSIENVAKAKGEIVDALPSDGVFYVNNDDPLCREIADGFAGTIVRAGAEGDVVLESYAKCADGDAALRISNVGEIRIPLRSRAHAINVLLAVAVGLRHGVEEFEAPLRSALANATRFKVFRLGPFEIIDDSYNANPSSVKAALDSLGERANAPARIAVLGDMLELGEAAADLHREVGRYAGRAGVTHLIARGEFAAVVVAGAQEASVSFTAVIDDHDEIAEEVCKLAPRGSVLLVKGSRGMKMENVIVALSKHYGEECAATG